MEGSLGRRAARHERADSERDVDDAVVNDIQADPDRAYWHRHVPAFVAHFDRDGVVELVEAYYSQGDQEQVTFGGVQLTFRLMDDVVADLEAAGMHARRMDIGFDFDEGFSVWSMSSLSTADLTGGSYDPDDERLVVEGVAVGTPSYPMPCTRVDRPCAVVPSSRQFSAFRAWVRVGRFQD